MRRKYRGTIALVAVVSLALAACTGSSKPQVPREAPTSVVVKADAAGTYQVGRLTVAVPKGAVAKDTTLYVTPAKAIDPKNAPLGATSVQFDLAFDGGAEPVQPLDVTIPLSGEFVPSGTQRSLPLVYMPVAPTGWRLLPSTVGGGSLHVRLTHLSPKIITYLDEGDVKQMLSEAANAEPPSGKCGTNVTTPELGKVAFDDRYNKGWGYDKNSPATPCFVVANGNPALNITNNKSFMFTVQSSRNVTIPHTMDSIDDEVIKQLTDWFFHDPIGKGYLAGDSTLQVMFNANNLPGKVRLVANQSTLLSDMAWRVTKLLIETTLGESTDDAAKLAQKLVLDTASVQSCLKAAIGQPKDVLDALNKMADVVTSKCGEVIGKALLDVLGQAFTTALDLANMWKRLLAVAGAVKDAVQLTVQEIERQAVTGDIDIAVKQVAPPGPKCPTEAEFEQLLTGVGFAKYEGHLMCDGGWLYAQASRPGSDVMSQGWSVLFQWDGTKWVYNPSGSSRHMLIIGRDPICDDRSIPAEIYSALCAQNPAP